MLTPHRTSGMFLSRPSFWRFGVFVVLLLVLVKIDRNATCAEPLPPNTVEGFRQFLTNDMDRLGKLVDLKTKTEAKIDMKEEHKDQNAYYQKVVDSLNSQINTEVKVDLDRATALENQINSAAAAASVLRLRAWEAPDTRVGLDALDKGALYGRISNKLNSAVADLVANGRPRDQAALCVMLGEDASLARTLKGEGRSYLLTLQKQIPQVVKLSQEARPEDRIVREAAAIALAELRAPAKDHIAAVEALLDKDGGDADARRAAYKALIRPFEAASPRNLAASPNATQYTATDQLAYATETRHLLDETAPLALPLLAKGLKDDDVDVRRISMNGLRDITSILLVPLQPAPRLGRDVIDYEFRLKPMIDIITRLQPLIDQLAANTTALIGAAGDPDPSVRLDALRMLNDLAESRNRVRGWRAQIDRAGPPPAPEKPVGDAPKVAEPLPAPEKNPPDKLTAAMKKTLGLLASNLSDPKVEIRLAALEVLENLGPEANTPDTLAALVNALGDRNKFVRWNTLRILSRFGPIEPKMVVPALVALVRDQDGDGDYAKMLGPTLSAYGADAAAAVPSLTKAIQKGEPDARIAYLQALTYVGPAAIDAIPAITGILRDSDPHVRQAAAETLGRFGKAAAPAAPRLRALLDDENPEVRKASAEALLRIDEK